MSSRRTLHAPLANHANSALDTPSTFPPRESLKQINEEIDILKSYLKTNDAPNVAVEVLEGLTIDHHKSWKRATDRIKKLLEE